LENGLYEKLGALSAYLVAWNGPMPNFLNMKTYLMVLGQEVDFTIVDIQDFALKQKLFKVSIYITPCGCVLHISNFNRIHITIRLNVFQFLTGVEWK
jgi:hypothetical protein